MSSLSQLEINSLNKSLVEEDLAIYDVIQEELYRQRHHLELIASENFVSKAVLEAQGSVLTNKYAEGYPGRRYYGGCVHVDKAENLALERVKKLFNCAFANVQPHSGAQANLAAFLALLNVGDTFLGMSLECGGHLTHGSPVTISGKWFKPVSYGVDKETGLINYDEVEALALNHKPKLILAGGSAYSRVIDFKKFREIADKVGAYLMVDMAHFSGLVAAGLYPSPLPYADVVTSTTHKTLRGPRGGIILSQNEELGKKINSAVFPGSQGGPLMHIIAAKAVAFGEALLPSFKDYAQQVIQNTKKIAEILKDRGFTIVSGGTDSHLFLVDLRSKNITGTEGEQILESVGITCNKNSIPFDPVPPKITSGIRLGAAAITTQGLDLKDCEALGHMIADILEDFGRTKGENKLVADRVKAQVEALCRAHPLY